MNRKMRRASIANGRSLQKKPWTKLEDTTAEVYAKSPMARKLRPAQVFQNSKYIVQIYPGCFVLGRRATKVMIRRSDAEPIYSWPDLQRIKNEIFGEEVEAIQLFPRQSELVDDAHMYWLWVLEA